MLALLVVVSLLGCTVTEILPIQVLEPEEEEALDSGPSLGTIPAWYDLDVDGSGGGEVVMISSWDDADPLLVPTSGDCDDSRSDIAPRFLDVCDGVDNDCDGGIDEDAPALLLFLDLDGDGHGSDGTTSPEVHLSGCDAYAVADPAQWAEQGGDCDDTNSGISPRRLDIPGDGIDTDCDGDLDG